MLPENAYTGELNYNFKKSKLNYSVSIFYAEVDNLIQWAPNEFFIWEPQNIKQVRNTGLEIGIDHSIIDTKNTKLNVGVSYTYVESITTKSTIEGDLSVGKQLIYVPKNSANVNLFFNYKGLSISYLQSVTDRTFIDDSNMNSLPGYSSAEASLNYTFDGFTIGLRAQNIYDQSYQVISTYPLPGRSFQLIMRFKFNS